MIGKLKGKIDSIYDNHFIIDVNGVGYLVYSSSKTLNKLETDEYNELLIETHVREDHIHLYGFYDIDEKSTFILLQSVKGVGTRMALAILSHLTPKEIAISLAAEDKNSFNTVSGVGKKLAERLITELKDKFIANSNITTSMQKITTPSSNISNDAISALINLGISKIDAYNRVNIVLSSNPEISLNELIKMSLKEAN